VRYIVANTSIILRHKYRGNGPIRSKKSTYWESSFGHGNGPIRSENSIYWVMGNTQYGNGHVTDQVERSINGVQQKLLQNHMCIL
jgi:hypothetical protein